MAYQMQHLSYLYGLFYGRGNRPSVNHGNAANFYALFLMGSGALEDRLSQLFPSVTIHGSSGS